MDQERKRRAIIVHNEPIFATSMTKALMALDFLVDVVVDPPAAIARMEQAPPDIVCVSLNLPRDSGYDLCEQIRENPALHRVQILLMSDRRSPDVVAHAEEAGATAFLPQPFEPELLVSYVSAMLELPHRPRSGALRRHPDEGVTLE
jgi:two-component system, OmpR family, alkaline phosphatase synthesis response regulator PhoP